MKPIEHHIKALNKKFNLLVSKSGFENDEELNSLVVLEQAAIDDGYSISNVHVPKNKITNGRFTEPPANFIDIRPEENSLSNLPQYIKVDDKTIGYHFYGFFSSTNKWDFNNKLPHSFFRNKL